MSSQKNIDYIEKEYDEINNMDIIGYREFDARDQINKNDEEKVTEDIEVLKLGKFSLQKNIDNIEKEYDERDRMDMSDEKYSDEREQISKNYEERVTDDIEVLKLGKLSSKQNIDNIERESDEINRMDMSDYKDSDEIDKIDKNMKKY